MLRKDAMGRKHLQAPFEVRAVSDTGEFEGYGSVFDVVDAYGEAVARGAFRASLEEHRTRGTMPAMLWQHNAAQPIGVYRDMREDDRGLLVKGDLALETVAGREAHTLLKMKALRGLSIGFVPLKEEHDHEADVTRLTEIDLWEVSLVTFPANPDAGVTGVKEIRTVREFERFLREQGGFSRSRAEHIAQHGFAPTMEPREGLPRDGAGVAEAIEAAERVAALMRS